MNLAPPMYDLLFVLCTGLLLLESTRVYGDRPTKPARLLELVAPAADPAQRLRQALSRLPALLAGALLVRAATAGGQVGALLPLLCLGFELLLTGLIGAGRGQEEVLLLGLLDHLQKAIRSGRDVFGAMADEMPGPPESPITRAFREALRRRDRREPLERCLQPLYGVHTALDEFASDLRRAGVDPSSGLLAVLQLQEDRLQKRWNAAHRRRVLADRTLPLAAHGRAAALGAVAAGLASAGPVGSLGWALAGIAHAANTAPLRRPALLLAAVMLVQAVSSPAALGEPPALSIGGWEAGGLPVRARFLAETSESSAPPGFVASEEPPAYPRAAPPEPQCRVETGYAEGSVRLRSAPGTASAVRGYLREGAVLRVLGEAQLALAAGPWLKVRTDAGLEGWLYGDYCRPVED